MGEVEPEHQGPDLEAGIDIAELPDGAMLRGHVGDEPVMLVRRGDDWFALGAKCTHYGGPLDEGILVGDTVRCPWHHACFSLGTGAALKAPALQDLPCYTVERRGDRIHVGARREPARVGAPPPRAIVHPRSVLIVGGGAAGNAAAEMLRREGFAGAITLLSADADLPCDRPNLSKNYLAGTAEEDWIPLHPAGFYREKNIEVHLDTRVASLDPRSRSVATVEGTRFDADALLLATGAEPIRLEVPGADLPHVRCLRSQADATALVERIRNARRAVVIGASFIGLEVASSLRQRGLEVHVVGRETVLMEKVLGAEVGDYLRTIHEGKGVSFHLGTTASAIDTDHVTLANGETLAADLVVVGIGVKPRLALAEGAELALDRGVRVDEFLQTSAPGVFAAGDIARWPDPLTGEAIRVEHWVVAERMGQAAARNMLGFRQPFRDVPFFWTEQHDFALAYVGHAAGFDEVRIDGSLAQRDCTITYRKAGRKLAVAVVGRDHEGLVEELGFERLHQPENAYTLE
ncbi:MAG: FAD-dependent oxidoreductase [Xanthomonadales bacterium]|nr:FAD-dependent oxidoreductase [Xanthomonadales bacterium]